MLHTILNKYKEAYKGLPPAVWFLSIVIFINRSGMMVLFFLSLYMTEKFGMTVPLAGKLISVYGIGSIVGAYLGGYISDKIGSIKVQLISLVGSGFLYLIFLFWTGDMLVMIFFNLLFLGLIAEAIRPATTTSIIQNTPAELRARAFAVQRLATNLGIAVGPALGGFIARINYNLLFIIDGVTCIIAALILYYFIRKNFFKIKQMKVSGKQVSVNPLHDRIFILLLFFCILLGTCFMQIISTWPIFLKKIYKINEGGIGLLLMINTIIIALVEIPLIHRLEKFNKFLIMSIGALLLCIGFGILPFGSSYRFAVFSLIIWTFGEIIIFPNLASVISNRADEDNVGKYMGYYSLAFAIAFSTAPIFGTFLYDAFSPNILWFFIGIIGIIISVGFLILKDKENFV